MIINQKNWRHVIDSLNIEIFYIWHISTRTSVHMYANGNLIASYGPRYLFGVATLCGQASANGSKKTVRCDLWAGLTGVQVLHRIHVDGALKAGPAHIEGWMLDYLPERSYWWYYAVHGILPGLVYTFLAHGFQPESPSDALFTFSFVSAGYSLALYLLGRFAMTRVRD